MKQTQKIHYNPILKKRARTLRKESTYSEILLWNRLKARQLSGMQFLRQKPIGNFIVDFYCRDLKLALEIEGKSHLEKEDHDKTKTEALNIFLLGDSLVPRLLIKKQKTE